MRRLALLLLLATASGCGGSDGDGGGPQPGASDAAADATSADSANQATAGFPCDVASILRARCQGCHGAPLAFGAPLPLLTWDDTRQPAPSGLIAVWESMKIMVSTDTMPPSASPTGPLTADEKRTLMAWLDAGAPRGTMACAAPAPSAPAPDAGTPPLPCTPGHEFRAYGATMNDPFTVPQLDDTYRCFAFQVPFASGEQATAWRPIVDDARVLHHWIAYAQPTKPTGCLDSNRTFVAGWAPGGGDMVLPADIGLDLPEPGSWISLEIHYNNKARHKDARDRSGVAFCTTKTPRAKEAGVITLGTNQIRIPAGATAHPVTGECSSTATRIGLREPIRVLSAFPHMHQLGVSFVTEVTHDGVPKKLVEIPQWDFHNQRFHALDPVHVISPGDSLRTVCTYKNPSSAVVRFGSGTADEMCLNFIVAYPIGSVASRTCTQ